ncbi:Guanosine-3',5'-bis(diphosphate) 3'-pyrophosphohydrolase [Geodia barretti]|uniref:Guanosine-3',5'-bis(Diphosphate) 3'-pyrophosphohydrolase n=1 Tax=Geodia barretti TaxID=519541 RepID=A0AA35SB86_GEOBA|nr:Guanosine-3',5'-bis(diphosphate) 3'-pyrophosphohydrolase [Geodia barretti]
MARRRSTGAEAYRAADPPDLDAVAKEFGFSDAEHLYAALGNGDLSIGKVISRIAPPEPKRRALRPQDRRDIRIQGMQNLMISLATAHSRWDRTYLLADIAGAISDAGSNIRDSTTRTDGHIAEQDFWIDVTDNEQLRQAIDQIERIEGVLEVLRVDEPANGDLLP